MQSNPLFGEALKKQLFMRMVGGSRESGLQVIFIVALTSAIPLFGNILHGIAREAATRIGSQKKVIAHAGN